MPAQQQNPLILHEKNCQILVKEANILAKVTDSFFRKLVNIRIYDS